MQFLKKHYDKIILSAVLLVLVVVAVALPFEVSKFKRELENNRLKVPGKPAAYEPADTSTNKALMARFNSLKAPDLSSDHKLFNPRPWRRTSEGTVVQVTTGIGLDTVQVIGINELKVRVELTNVETNLAVPADAFKFVPPEGVFPEDITEQFLKQIEQRQQSRVGGK